MITQQQALKTTEKYVVWLMVIIGFSFISLQAISFVSSRAKAVVVNNDHITMSRNELLSLIRVFITIVLSFAGAWLFSKKKSSGWVMSFANLSLFTTILAAILYGVVVQSDSLDIMALIGCFSVLILFIGIVFLFRKSTRLKYRADSKSILSALALFIVLGIFYFFLQ
ncbi:MAG TPA: hypothetical protein VM012_06170 [Flavitalea sp.]|nr:hypothetical protein [Flavitalea sp.]